jgi:hypothetical protein
MPIILVRPNRQLGGSLIRGLIRSCVGPFAQRRLNEAFGFSVGFRRIGFGSQVLDLQSSTGPREGKGSISRPIVGHDARRSEGKSRSRPRSSECRGLTIVHVSSLRPEIAERYAVRTATDEHRGGSREWLQQSPSSSDRWRLLPDAAAGRSTPKLMSHSKPERCGETLSLIVMRPASGIARFLKTSSIVNRRSLWTRRSSYLPLPPDSYWRLAHRPWRRRIQARASPAA